MKFKTKRLNEIKDRKSFWYRQRKKRGFDDRETWNLYFQIAKFVYPRLVRFKEVNNGYPGNSSEEEWDDILDKIVYSMKFINDETEYHGEWKNSKEMKADFRRVQKGFELFGKYFQHLWW